MLAFMYACMCEGRYMHVCTLHVCMRICMYAYMYVRMHAYMHVYIYIYISTCICIYIYMYMYTCMYGCKYTYMYTHIYTPSRFSQTPATARGASCMYPCVHLQDPCSGKMSHVCIHTYVHTYISDSCRRQRRRGASCRATRRFSSRCGGQRTHVQFSPQFRGSLLEFKAASRAYALG